MTSRQNEYGSPHGIEEHALAWLAHDPAAFNRPEVFVAFGAWLQADPRHRDAFIRLSLARRSSPATRTRPSVEDVAAPERPALLQEAGTTVRRTTHLVFALLLESARSAAIFLLIGLAALAIDRLLHLLQPLDLSPALSSVIRGATCVIVLGDIAVFVLLQARTLLRLHAGQRAHVPARQAVSGG